MGEMATMKQEYVFDAKVIEDPPSYDVATRSYPEFARMGLQAGAWLASAGMSWTRARAFVKKANKRFLSLRD